MFDGRIFSNSETSAKSGILGSSTNYKVDKYVVYQKLQNHNRGYFVSSENQPYPNFYWTIQKL